MTSEAPTALADCTNILRRSPRLQKSKSVVHTSTSTPSPSHSSAALSSATLPFTLSLSNPSDEQLAGPVHPERGSVEGGAIVIQVEDVIDDMTKAFTFLSSFNKNALRKLCKEWKCRSSGNKPDLLYRAMRRIMKLHSAGKDTTSILDAAVKDSGFTKFLNAAETIIPDWKKPPSEEHMMHHLKEVGDKVIDDTTHDESERGPNFTNSEFARLVIIMRDDERAKRAMFSLSQPLDRLSLDAGMGKESYWNIIADRFNNRAVPVNFDFRGAVDDIDPSKAPLCERSGTVLKDQWQKARPQFTRSHKNWQASGQNDPDRFVNFLTENADGSLTAASVRALILFVCCRLGTPNVNDLLFQSATKLMVHGGSEEGMPANDWNYPEEERDKKRRKRASDDLPGKVKGINDNIDKVHSILTSCIQASTGGPVDKGIHLWDNEEECFKLVEDTFQAMQRVKEYGDSRIAMIAEVRYRKALAKYEQVASIHGDAIQN